MARTLSEYESKGVLRSYGIPVVREALAAGPDDAAVKAGEIGFPVALKLCGAGIAHKTERNLVCLDLGSVAEVRAAASELLAKRTPEERDAMLLVQQMVRGRRELIVGMIRDPQFGPCVMLGLGGILAEVMRDVVFRMAPIDRADAEQMLGDLKGASILGPFRGEPAVDVGALAPVLIAAGRIGIEREEVLSLDINPLIITTSTDRGGALAGVPIAVDALVEISGA